MGWRRRIVYAMKEAYGILSPPPKVFLNTIPASPGTEQGGDALHGRDFCDVAAARLQGTVPPQRSPPASLRQWIGALPGMARDLRRHRSQGTDRVRRRAFGKEKSGNSLGTERAVATVQGRARRERPTAAASRFRTPLPVEEPEIERYRSPHGRLPRAGHDFFPRFPSRA